MRYGILSDIHSNQPALERVVAELDEAGVDRFVCLGDIVGYGPNPNECCEILRKRQVLAIMGNHDEGALSNENDDYFNDLAQEAIAWTRRTITPKNRDYLAALPDEMVFDSFEIVHGSTDGRFEYILSASEALRALGAAKKPLTFFGHSHIAEVYFLDPNGGLNHEQLLHGGSIAVEPGFRYIVNPGSVGQPRDRNPQASCAIFDERQRSVEIRRVTYDVTEVQRRMQEAHLPHPLAARLALGR